MPKNQYLLFSIVWFFLTAYGLLSDSSTTMPPPFPHFDKFVHFSLFFGQTWLLGKIFLKENRRPPYVGLLLFLGLWAISSELLQGTLTKTRTADVLDILADVTGAVLAMLLIRYLVNLKQKIGAVTQNQRTDS